MRRMVPIGQLIIFAQKCVNSPIFSLLANTKPKVDEKRMEMNNNILCLAIREVLIKSMWYKLSYSYIKYYTELLKPPKNGQTKNVVIESPQYLISVDLSEQTLRKILEYGTRKHQARRIFVTPNFNGLKQYVGKFDNNNMD